MPKWNEENHDGLLHAWTDPPSPRPHKVGYYRHLNVNNFLMIYRVMNTFSKFFAWTRRRSGDRAFSVAAPRAWNRPTELKLLRSTDLFRRDLKTFLFHSVYGHQDTIDSVMRPRSPGRKTSASVTVTVTVKYGRS